MKKTLTVNLNGRVFHMDEDAYQLLDNYLQNLRIHFRNEEGNAEILTDFEARIEELLSDRIRLGYHVISIEAIEKIITQMGRPNDFGTQEGSGNEQESNEKNRKEHYTTIKKKLYRNPNDKMFGGVCSGIASYYEWNVTALRIIAAILVPATYLWIIPIYLILWLIIPEAATAEQKLEMQGKPITVENIGKTVTAGAEESKQNTSHRGCLGSLVDFIVAFFKVGLIGLLSLIGLPLIFALIIVIIVLFATLLGVGTGIVGGLIPWSHTTFLFVNHPSLATSAFCLIIGVPLVALVYSIISHLFKWKPVHKGVKWTGIIIWLAALIALPFSGFKADWSKWENRKHWQWEHSFHGMDMQGDGNITNRLEQLSSVHSIELNGTLKINLQIEPNSNGENTLIINGDSNLLDKITVRDISGKLIMENKEQYNLHPTVPIRVRLQTTVPIEKIKTNDATEMNLANGLQIEKLSVEAKEISRLNLYDLRTDQLKLNASGASEVHISGDTEQANYNASGVAKIYTFDFKANTVSANASGASLIQCNPVKSLKAKASGIANLWYKQEPEYKSMATSGIGKIGQE